MMATKKIITSSVAPMETEETIGSLFCKTQLCGKKRCRCVIKSLRHGPYLWLVKYIPVEKWEEGKKYKHSRYQWIYLGPANNPAKIEENIEEHTGGYGPVYTYLEAKVTTFQEKFETDPEFRQKILQEPKTKLED